MNSEQKRLDINAQKEVPLEKWGTYLSERQWATVREDYSANGDAWSYFPHDHARSRAYRWGEDGLGGISDTHQNLCFALALWNGNDQILKERLFGLTGVEGNHGEDVKELYYFLDNTPTHSYMKFLYKYPFDAFPYQDLINSNAYRSKQEPEYEILDSGVFDNNRYFDVFVEYAKNFSENDSEDICINITVTNRSAEDAKISVLPTLWFRNTWSCGDLDTKPQIKHFEDNCVIASHKFLGDYYLYYQTPNAEYLTDNETNFERLYEGTNASPFVKDAFHDAICKGNKNLHNQLINNKLGTKFSPVYELNIAANSSKTIQLRLVNSALKTPFDSTFYQTFIARKQEADEFYLRYSPKDASDDLKSIQRQAFAGLLWSKQYYQYDIERWLAGDPNQIPPPIQRQTGRNSTWKQLKNQDIIIMPDTWEYPWYAAWDLAFHCIPMAMIDPNFAKNQLILIMREWYMSPDGQIPAYEWNFSDVNPPVHAWAALCIYRIEKTIHGKADVNFLKRVFQKLLINFTWWANREDENGNNIFSGGFLGLDNIGVIDRDHLPPNSHLEQVDATSWMAMYALNMMDIALEISMYDESFEDVTTKFYEHFIIISECLNEALWDADDNFYYDLLTTHNGKTTPMKVRSVVGLSVLFGVSMIDQKKVSGLTDFTKRINYIKNYYKNANKALPNEEINEYGDVLLSLVSKERLVKLLQAMLNEDEFLSIGGIRAVSKFHKNNPYSITIQGQEYSIGYVPADSDSGMFGGNSNWRGPVWMPINYLIIKSLKKYHQFYGDDLKVEFPTHSGNFMNLEQVSDALAKRITSIFETNNQGNRPVHGAYQDFYRKTENQDLPLFFEYFDGDTARGVGASHQTGWTAVVAELINDDAWEWE